MDTIDSYLVARCHLLANALLALDDLDSDTRADALRNADLLDALAEVLTEAGMEDS